MNRIEKLALNAQKAREMAKKVGLLPEGNWKWALRKLRGKRGELLKDRELSEAKHSLGSLPNNLFQKIKAISERKGHKVEVGLGVNKGEKIPHFSDANEYHKLRKTLQKEKPNYRAGVHLTNIAKKIKNGYTNHDQERMHSFIGRYGHSSPEFIKTVIDNADNPEHLHSLAQRLMQKYKNNYRALKTTNKKPQSLNDKIFLGLKDGAYVPKNKFYTAHTHPSTDKYNLLHGINRSKKIIKNPHNYTKKGLEPSAEDIKDLKLGLIDKKLLAKNIVRPSGINKKYETSDVDNMILNKKESIISPEKLKEGIHVLRPKGVRSVYLDRAPRKALEKKAELNKDVKLYPHQQRVVDNPATSQIIAHSVGSGKTLTSIAKFERMKQEGKARRALVIVPAGLRDNFGHSNVKKFTNSKYNIVGTQQEIKKRTHTGIDPNSDYNIMSYEIFKRNPEKYLADSGADTVISDESHRGKNEDTTLTKALKRARKLYANHIGLTGSIVSNSLADVHPLVDVASGGKHTLGKNKKEFEQRYIRRSNAPQYRDLPEKRRPVIGFKNERELKRNLSANIDYADFEDIKDIANMPGKNLKIRKVPLNPEQVKAYKRILNKHPGIMKLIKMKRLETLKDEEAAKAFSGLIEARKLMNSLGSVRPGMSAAESAEATPKTRKLLDDLTQHLGSRKDAKALLFSHLITGGVDTLEAGLQQRHIPYGRFIGKGNPGSTEEIRQQDVTDYNQGKKKVMIVSSAGGEGLSLDNTTWEGILDPHYNPEKMKQMEARGIRSGGLSHLPKVERHVQVNRYLATMPSFLGIFKSRIKTPDEFIYEIASHKDAQNERLFSLLKDMQSKKRFASPKKGDIAHSVTAMPQQSDYSV